MNWHCCEKNSISSVQHVYILLHVSEYKIRHQAKYRHKLKVNSASSTAVGPKQTPSQCLPNFPFRGLKWLSRENDDSVPSSSSLKNVCGYSSTISFALLALKGMPVPYNYSFVYMALHSTHDVPILHGIRMWLRKFTVLTIGSAKIQNDTKKTGTFEKPNKNWRNPRKKFYWQKLNHYNLPFKRQ